MMTIENHDPNEDDRRTEVWFVAAIAVGSSIVLAVGVLAYLFL
jgi:hypothetical protein